VNGTVLPNCADRCAIKIYHTHSLKRHQLMHTGECCYL